MTRVFTSTRTFNWEVEVEEEEKAPGLVLVSTVEERLKDPREGLYPSSGRGSCTLLEDFTLVGRLLLVPVEALVEMSCRFR